MKLNSFVVCLAVLIFTACSTTQPETDAWHGLQAKGSSAPAISPEKAIERAVNRISKTERGYQLEHPLHTASFDTAGFLFTPKRGGENWRWELTHAGTAGGVKLSCLSNKVELSNKKKGVVQYNRGCLTEQYVARKDTVEQQFVIPQALPLLGHDLVIRGSVSSTGNFEQTEKGWAWRSKGGVVSLGDVYVYDAQGNQLPAKMLVASDKTEILVDGAALATATYPVVIDPEIGANDFRISEMDTDGSNNFAAWRPAVAYNSSGNEFLVVWKGDTSEGVLVDNEFEIFGQRINASTGVEVGTDDFRISDMGPNGDADYDAFEPAVAYNPTNNEYLVVWEGEDDEGSLVPNEFEIYGQRLNAATGAEVGTNDFRISDMGPDGNPSYNAELPDVVYNATNGEYLVVWRGDEDSIGIGEDEIFGQRIIASTGAETGTNDFRISDMGTEGSSAFDATDPAVAFNSTDGEYLVVWSGDDNVDTVTNEMEIFGQRLTASTGAEVGTNDFRISDMGPEGDISYEAEFPDVAYNSTDNQYLVVWSGDDFTAPLVEGEHEIFGQRLSAAGEAVGDNDFQISAMGPNGDAAYDAAFPNVHYNSLYNEYFVIWTADDDSGALIDNEYEVYGRQVVADTGAFAGSQVRLSDMGTDGVASRGVLSETPLGLAYSTTEKAYLLAWQADDDDSGLADNEWEIFGQRYAPYQADVRVTKSDSADPFTSGGTLTYTLEVDNLGPTTAKMLTVTDALPSDVTYSSASGTDWTCSESSGTVTCTLDELAVGSANDITIEVAVDRNTDTTISNTASVSVDSPDPATGDNSDTEETIAKADTDGDGTPNDADTDDDGDGLSDADEATEGTDPLDSDSDDDGVQDGQEVTDGSNPLDRGSFLPVLGTTLCFEWNGFLGGMWNIAEHVNMTAGDLDIESTLNDINGAAQSVSAFTVGSGAQQDILVHTMTGWTLDSYGQVCSEVDGGTAGDLDGRMVYYKETSTSTPPNYSFQFAFAMPFLNGITGDQFVPFNTFQPSLDGADASNLVTNWIQITNLENSAQTGTLTFYGQDGTVLGTQDVSLDAGARRDYSGHQFGTNLVGMVRWGPDTSTARFQLRNVRYYYDNAGTENSFTSAFQLEGMVGSGEQLAVPLDTTSGSSIIEIGNTTSSDEDITVRIYNASGDLVETLEYTLSAYGSVHVITDGILTTSQGIATVRGTSTGSIIAVVMQYERTASMGISFLYGILAKQPLGTTMRGSYNTFLSQGCRLLLVNPTGAAVTANIGMVRYDGTDVLSGAEQNVPAHGLVDYDLCSNDIADAYGVVTVQSGTANALFPTVVRVGSGNSYRFPTPVRQ